MESPGRFICGACRMHCSIDRFEVGGRKFPFGGRCSLYESVWKRKAKTAAAPDLIEQRAGLIFGKPADQSGKDTNLPLPREPGREHDKVKLRVGIPRALTTYSLYPLYSTFLSGLGLEVILSGVDPHGELKSYSGFCFPVQTAHGAVLDLTRQGVNLVFLPHVVRMPRSNACRDSFLCPITQASPYFLAKAFSEVCFLSPRFDFTHGYEIGPGLTEIALREFGAGRERVQEAWDTAKNAQTKTEQAMRELGQGSLDFAIAEGKPVVLLAGRSYNAYAAEASQSVGKKLSSMGVLAIPADCLAPIEEGPTSWHFSNQVLNAVALARKHPHLFLMCVSNYSCTIDAFTHALIASGMGSKPYLVLEIDAHTADAGVQTRLEAFLDIIRNYREIPTTSTREFFPCRLDISGKVISSTGEQVALNDPRVKLYFPNFSEYHSGALAMAVRWVGLHAGGSFPLDRGQLEQGLRYTSGRECLPLPLCVGQLIRIHNERQPGEIAGYFTLQGGAPCVVDSYRGYLERFIEEQRLADLFLFSPKEKSDNLGFNRMTLAKDTALTLLVADIVVEIEHVLRVVGAPGSVNALRREWDKFVAEAGSLAQFQANLPGFVAQVAALPRIRDPRTCPRVVVMGDFFTRFSPFFMEGVLDLYTDQCIILKPVDLSDLLLYHIYNSVAEAAQGWDLKPGSLAFAKACTRILQNDGKGYLQNWLAYHLERWYEGDYRKLFGKTGLLVAGPNDAAALFEKASAHVAPEIYGEILPTVGRGLEAETEGYDGIIVIGPFNCLPFRISESILRPLCVRQGMSILTYESDGYAVSPSVLRQIDVHIQQVLEHAAGNGKGKD
ncbi:MAG: acyl-CoA dehydratase activase-related protein, partial [Betaproteobacteria bacterium]